MYPLSVLILTITLCCVTNGKIFTRCGLAAELKKQRFPIDKLPDWVCLVESESARDTKAIGTLNTDGTKDWGLFQINDGYWCGQGTPAGACYVACDSLLSDNIKTASRCAMKIFRYHGFHAWVGWKNKCQGDLPDLSSCNL